MGRRALVLVIALVLAGVAAFSIFQYLSGIEEDVIADQEEVVVFRAINPIAEGTEGTFILQGRGTLFEESTEQLEDLPQGAIQNQDQLQSILGGRVAAGPISVFTQPRFESIALFGRENQDIVFTDGILCLNRDAQRARRLHHRA